MPTQNVLKIGCILYWASSKSIFCIIIIVSTLVTMKNIDEKYALADKIKPVFVYSNNYYGVWFHHQVTLFEVYTMKSII